MPKILSDSTQKISVKKTIQITESHCGPAVVQMLLSHLGIHVSQKRITEGAGAEKTIRKHGTRVDQLAQAVKKLYPDLQFWYKKQAKLDDIRTLLRKYHYPVGVEWQGIFGGTLKNNPDTDFGHYSIVIEIIDKKREIIIADPYKDFTDRDCIISTYHFGRRWWDFNEVKHPKTRAKKIVKDHRMLFVITKKETVFPSSIRLKKYG